MLSQRGKAPGKRKPATQIFNTAKQPARQSAKNKFRRVIDFTALIGSVLTTGNPGEVMKLREGDLQVNADGTFRFTRGENCQTAPQVVVCRVNEENGNKNSVTEKHLDLNQWVGQSGPDQPRQHRAGPVEGNIFDSVPGFNNLKNLKEDTEHPAGAGKSDSIVNAPPITGPQKISESPKSRATEHVEAKTAAAQGEKQTRALDVNSSANIKHPVLDAPPEIARTSAGKAWQRSLYFTFDEKGKQMAVGSELQPDQITVDTYNRRGLLFLDIDSTFNPRTLGSVQSCSLRLRDGSPLPDCIREIRNGFYCMEEAAETDEIYLQILFTMQNGNHLACNIKFDTQNGFIQAG